MIHLNSPGWWGAGFPMYGGRVTGLNVGRELPPSKLKLGFLTKTFCAVVSPS